MQCEIVVSKSATLTAGLQFLGWAETLDGDMNITLTEKGSDKALVFIMPKPKDKDNQ